MGLISFLDGVDLMENELPNQEEYRKAMIFDFGGKSWSYMIYNLYQLFIFAPNFLVCLNRFMPAMNRYLSSVINNRWFDDETTIFNGLRIHKIRATMLKIRDDVSLGIITKYSILCAKRTSNLSYFKNEDGENGIKKRISDNFPLKNNIKSFMNDISSIATSGLLEIYTLSRSFREFQIDENESKKNIILYLGDSHVNHISHFLMPILRELADNSKLIVEYFEQNIRCTEIKLKNDKDFHWSLN